MTKLVHDSETPAVGQQKITAVALIHHDFGGVKKVFLPKRADTKKFLPGIYEVPGGHIDFGENIIEGLKREICEEFEIDINVGDPFYVFDYHNDIKGTHTIEAMYFATLISPLDAIRIHPEDHSTYSWFGEDELHTAYSRTKGADDQEFIAIKRAFELLEGAALDVGH